MEKRTTQRDTIKDITSDNQVNSYFPYRWSPASLTFNIYLYLFLCLSMTRTTINNETPHLKSPKNQNRRAGFGRPAMENWGWSLTCLRSTNPRPWFCLGKNTNFSSPSPKLPQMKFGLKWPRGFKEDVL